MAVRDTIPVLARITPAECRTSALAGDTKVHVKLGTNRDHIQPAERNARETSRQASLIHALRTQRAEIIKYHQDMVNRHGHDVSLDDAARDWIRNHAASWRAEYEAGRLGTTTDPTTHH